jgi:predicted amidohydrolase YtcJ
MRRRDRLGSATSILPVAVLLALGLVLGACAKPAAGVAAKDAADTLYSGGEIVTVNDAQPGAEALAVKDGRILAVGTLADLEKSHRGAATKVVDLQGHALVPGFVDGHVHVMGLGAQAIGANLLAPPDGPVNTIDDVVTQLKGFAAGPDVQRAGWIFGMGYDDALLGRHPTRDDLDRVSTEIPVIVVHISGHFSVMNSAGLAKVGYSAATRDPEGGVIRRRPDSREPNGVLEGAAHFPVMVPAISPKTPEDADYYLKRGLELAKSYGHTTVSEGRLFGPQQAGLASAAERGLLDIDVNSYVDYLDRKIIAAPWFGREYHNRYRIAGMKVARPGARFRT